VVDTLYDWTKGQNSAVAYFYFDFAAKEEQSLASILSCLLKQVVGELKEVPAKIAQVFQDEVGGRELELGQVVEMLQDISQPIFICIDALDECKAECRAKLLDSLKQILHKSPSTRIFLAGRLHIRGEVEKRLAGRVVAVSVTPTQDDIIRFLRAKLEQDTHAIGKSLEEDIIKKISETISEV